MRNLKKVVSFILTIVMAWAIAGISVFADPVTGSITIANAVKGQTYSAYKVFDVTSSGSGDSIRYAYTISSDNVFFETVNNFATTETNGLTLEKTGSGTVYNVIADSAQFTEAKAGELAAALSAVANKGTTAGTGTASATDNSVTCTISSLTSGYYFVDTTVGTLCSLNTVTGIDSVTVQEKNTEPTITKQVKNEKDNTAAYAEKNTASIGDTLSFQVTVTAGKGAQNYVLHDKLDNGLTFSGDSVSAVYKENGSTGDGISMTENTDYTVTNTGFDDGCSFEVTISKALNDGDQVVITYKAVLNENAVIAGAGNKNTAVLKYGENHNISTTQKETVTYSYSFDLVKTDGENKLLNGAKFKLYDAQAGGNEIKVVKVNETNGYRVAKTDETGVEIEAGKVTVSGLGSGTYYLEETAAPEGYNKLTGRQAVKITGANLTALMDEDDPTIYTSGGVQVINQSGAVLPSTGGMGTKLFYVLGGILAVAAGVLLITKKRMNDGK